MLIRLLAIASILLASTASAADKLDLSNPNDVIKARMKISCSLKDGEPTIYWWEGKMYSRRPGEKDRVLFLIQGMNTRACKTMSDPKRGLGYRSVSREVMFYVDPETRQIARTWKNPWSGETVDVIQVANDPVNMRAPTYAYDENGAVAAKWTNTVLGEYFLSGGPAARLFYDNPMAGDYQDYVGGTYHAMEFGSDAVNAKQLLDAKNTRVDDAVLSWARVSKWLPWMKMGDRDGVAIFHTAGMKARRFDDLPEPMRSEIKTNYPKYQSPPSIDDTRPNETSWTVAKREIDALRAKKGIKPNKSE